MSLFLQFIFLISIILFSAKIAGYISVRLGQASVLGELLVGILLGPSVINLLGLPFIEHSLMESIADIGEMGVMLLMFLAGLELNLGEMRQNMKVAALSGTLGVVFPVLFGWGTGRLFGLDDIPALFLGLTLGATSVSISAQTLIELRALRSRVGLSLLGAAVFDDILVILLLSVFLGLQGGGGSIVGILLIIVRMILFLGFSFLLGLKVLPRLIHYASQLPISQGVLSATVVIMLVYGLAAELFGGMAAITGAFIAGLMLARTPEKEHIETGIHTLAYGLFVPVFFVNIGLFVDLRSFETSTILFTLVVILVAVVGKWVGAGWGGRLGGLPRNESIQLGAGMISRGEVGLIVASVGISSGLMAVDVVSSIIVTVLATTLITPPILRALFMRENDARAQKIESNESEVS